MRNRSGNSTEGRRERLNNAWCRSPRGWREVGCFHGSRAWVPARCRHCEGCAEQKRRAVMRRVVEGLKDAGASAAFLTLTSLPNTSVQDMMAAWNRFKTALRREVGGFEYAAIKEFGSTTGMLHLHVVLTGWSFFPQHTLSAMWRKASRGAYVVDIRAIPDPERTARYVAKYVAKTIARLDVRKAVTYSRGWPKLAEREARWRVTGDEWNSPAAPPKRWLRVLAGGALVSVDRGCVCVSETARPYAATDVLRDHERQRGAAAEALR